MQLVIDFGNTLQKLALFQGNELLEVKSFHNITAKEFQGYVEAHPALDGAILSSVINFPEQIRSFLEKLPHFIELEANTALPVKNLYLSPETLGHDRIAVSVAAAGLFPGRNILVIDAGTCITYDLVNKQNEYLGGAISPGINMRFKAMHTFTGKLPLVEPEEFSQLIGKNTRESLLSGVMNGIIAETEGIVSRYRENFDDLIVIFTGGDHKILYNKLKSNIFAVPDLLLKGLKIILDYNA